MGEWFDFEFRFEHRKDSMSQLLMDDGIAVLETDNFGSSYLKIDIKKLCSEIYEKINKENIAKGKELREYFRINYKGDGLQYYSKWVMDEIIVTTVSRYFKDDVIYVLASYSGNGSIFSYFVKNGRDCLRDGTPTVDTIHGLSPNCINKINEDNYQVSIPIGEDNDKWGTFTVTKNNIEWREYVRDGVVYPERQQILLAEDIEVEFKNFSKTYTAKELADAYFDSKNTFYNKMHAPVFLENLDMCYFNKRVDKYSGNAYYIVHIPCAQDVSEDGSISITVSEYDMTHPVSKSLCNINLGVFGKERSIQIVKDKKNVRTQMKPADIVKHYNKTLEV